MFNQGGSDYGSDILGWYYYVYWCDLICFFGYFDQVVKYDMKNVVVFYNYFLVCDIFGMEGMKDYYV